MYDKYMQLTWNDAIQFLRGIGVTLSITLISLIIGTIIGAILGLVRCSKNKVVSSLPLILIEPLRNSPLVVQLFLIFYGLPMVTRIILEPYPAAIITLSLNTAAFFAVLVHSSIKAVPEMQWQAGYALGHDLKSTFIYIIFRQSLRILVPQAITLYISQLQCSSLVALIGLMDLTKTGELITLRTMKPFTVLGIVFLLYYFISTPLAKLAQKLEKRVGFSY